MHVRFRATDNLLEMATLGAKQPPNFPGTACSPSGLRLGGNLLFAQFCRHIVSAFPSLTAFGQIQPGVKQ